MTRSPRNRRGFTLVELMIAILVVSILVLIAVLVVLGALGFLYALWAIYGDGAQTVFLGFLLILAGIPVHVAIKWRNRNDKLEEI